MKDETLIPLSKCLDVNLRDKESVDITALHETGHLIVMYALDMMESFLSISIKGETLIDNITGKEKYTNGLTKMSQDYVNLFLNHSQILLKTGTNVKTGREMSKYIHLEKVEGAKLFLPVICKQFGGGAICRYYGLPDEEMCKYDYDDIDKMLPGLGLPGTREAMRILVDMYLKSVFESFDLLTKAIYKNLKKMETLNKEQVMQIIEEWEIFKFPSI